MNKAIKIFFVFLALVLMTSSFAQLSRNGLPHVQHLAPEVKFSWQHACLGDSVHFINQAIRGNTYQWYVMSYDTTAGIWDTLYRSNDTNIVYPFTAPGSYYVFLEANNGHIIDELDTLVIDTTTRSRFDFMACSNQFVNHSTCSTSWRWDFGDGTSSTEEMPVHQYADTGHYSVKLISCKGIVCDTMNKMLFVSRPRFALADFTYYRLADTLIFYASDTTQGMLYNWSYGDGTFDQGRSVKHAYGDTASYHLVTLLARNACGNAFQTDTIFKPTASASTPQSTLNFSSSSLLIFPNPGIASSGLTCYYYTTANCSATVTLSNELGQQVSRTEFTFTAGVNNFGLNTDALGSGMYFVTLSANGTTIRTKLLMQRTP